MPQTIEDTAYLFHNFKVFIRRPGYHEYKETKNAPAVEIDPEERFYGIIGHRMSMDRVAGGYLINHHPCQKI